MVQMEHRSEDHGSSMDNRPKVLIVDDDRAIRETYPELLAKLPSRPEVRVAKSGSRALAMLADDDYRLLICDLGMPRMDGLQILTVVRQKYPQLRTVAITGLEDEQLRSRTYALGVDLFWQKPTGSEELQSFAVCLEALLGQENDSGFRGVQSKSLVDLLQMECMAQNSVVLRICNGPLTARIWILDGEIIDAEIEDLRGEPAFQKVLSWHAGSFETLPAEPSRPRTIFKSCSSLLLESASVLDEARSQKSDPEAAQSSPLSRVAGIDGLEFVIARPGGNRSCQTSRGAENADKIGDWAGNSIRAFKELGEQLRAGPLEQIDAKALQRQVTIATHGDAEFCIGWRRNLEADQVRESTKKVFALWES